MKNIKNIMMALILSLVLSVWAHAAEAPCRVGYWYLPGYHEQNADGDRFGYGYDYVEKIAACIGWNIQYVGYDKSWFELLGMLEKGEIDLLTDATRTPDRERRFDYANRPIGLSFTLLTVKAGDIRYSPNDYTNWNGIKIGMVRENSRNRQFSAFAAEKGFRFVPVIYATYMDLEKALAAGKVDALLSTSSRETKDEWILEKINPDPVYIIVRKGDKKRLDMINKALSLLEINAPNLNETLVLRHYSANLTKKILLTKEESEFIKKARANRRVFRALMKPDRVPLCEYRNGELVGIFRDIVDVVRERSQLNIELIPCRTRVEYDERLHRGDYDIIFDAWRNYPHAERSGLYLTEPYYVSQVSLLQLKKRSSKTGKKGVFKNVWLWNELKRRGADVSSLLPFDSGPEMISAILNGTIDAGYMHTPMAAHAVTQDRLSLLTATTAYGLQAEYAIGIKRSLPSELIRIIGKTVRTLSDDDLRHIISAYDVPLGGIHSLNDWAAAHPAETAFFIFLILFLVIVALSFIIFSGRLMYRNGKIIKRLPVRFFVSDRAGNVLLYNAPDLVLKHRRRKISDLDTPDIANIMSRAVHEAFEKGVSTVDYVHHSTRRSARAERLSFSIFGRDTVIWISQNTEELQASKDQLQLAVEKARNAEKAKSCFLATMSHEIRTPLNAVIGFSELLKSARLSPAEQRDYLNDVSFAGNALLALINDVLDLSKLEAGQMEFVSRQTDFPALLHEVITIFTPRCSEKGLKISVAASAMPSVFIDHLRLRQILFNLVGNAVKFTEHGEIVVTASFLPGQDGKTGTLSFAVKDTGRGISADDQKILFRPFVQSRAMRGTQAANNGTGLGLAIVRRMIVHMKGDITLKSVPGEGSTFSVTLCGVPFGKKDDVAVLSEKKESSFVPIEKRSILLVDDVAMNLKVESAMLKELGMEVSVVSCAADALKQLETRTFDYLLTDLWMPDMTGDALARKVHAIPRLAHVKIIAVTADAEGASNFDMSVFTRILTKPITMNKLRNLFQFDDGRGAE